MNFSSKPLFLGFIAFSSCFLTSQLFSREVHLYSMPKFSTSDQVSIYQTNEDLLDKEKMLIAHVVQSIQNSSQGKSKVCSGILEIEGMSNNRVRHFLNNICSRKGTSYLEIGSWKGSTFTSALYGNSNALEYVVGIDNWSEFGGPAKEFKRNCKRFIASDPYEFYHLDCFSINLDIFKHKIDTYFYDGVHTEESQCMAFKYFDSIFEDSFIAIVDDWNAEHVRVGTFQAFKDLSYEILFEADLIDKKDPSFTEENELTDSWWNGLYVAVIRKSKK